MEKIIKPWVLIHNHLQDRDYPGSCNLAAHLEAIGYRTSIIGAYIKYQGQRYHYLDFIPIAKPDIVVIPKTIDLIKLKNSLGNFKKYKPFIVCIPTEFGAFYRNESDFKSRNRISEDSIDFKGANLLLLANETERIKFINTHSYDQNLVIEVIGHPRLDFYHKSFSPLASASPPLACTIVKPTRFKNNKIITFATSFPDADLYHNKDSKKYKEQSERLAKFKIRTKEEFDERVNCQYEDRLAMMKLLKYLSQNYDEFNYMIKVHPAENKDWYIKEISHKKNNVELVSGGLSKDFLRLSSLHVHCYCLTGVEAMVREIPTIHYQSKDSKDQKDKSLIKDASFQASSIEDFEKIFTNFRNNALVKNESLRIKQRELLKNAFSDNLGSSARLGAQAIKLNYEKLYRKLNSKNSKKFYNVINTYNRYGSTTHTRLLFYLKLKIKKMLINYNLLKKNHTYDPEKYFYPTARKHILLIKKKILSLR